MLEVGFWESGIMTQHCPRAKSSNQPGLCPHWLVTPWLITSGLSFLIFEIENKY